MSGFKNIQTSLGKLKLKKERKRLQRNIKAFNIANASSVGIIYNATNRNDSDVVKKFTQFLKEERKEVLSLGFIDSKDSANLVKPHLNYTYFDRSHLSKSMVPKGSEVDNFINKSFSILIDLNAEDCFPIEYITTLSSAKFKVGAHGSYRNEACDLVINLQDKQNLEYLIIQIKHYLQMINN